MRFSFGLNSMTLWHKLYTTGNLISTYSYWHRQCHHCHRQRTWCGFQFSWNILD